MSILFLACLLAICLPILSVQLPRFLPHLRTSRSNTTENRSPLHERPPPLRRRLRQGRSTPAPRSRAQHGGREATDGADSGAPSTGEETGSEAIHIQPPIQTGLLKVEGKGKGRADGKEVGRKPWDPPFPKKTERVMDNGWFVMPTPPKKTGRELEAKGVARRLFPPDGDGEYTYDREPNDGIIKSDREATPRPTPKSTPAPGTQDCVFIDSAKLASAKKKGKSKPGVIPAVWICVGIFAVLIFILAFAILVAHCLAWFLVYKTEARLGEARRGIMQGGEMRLCLCAT